MFAIETTQLTKGFAGRPVVEQVDLQVAAGCVYGFLGPNGAGKTTTMRLVLGLLRADAGRIAICGHDIARDRLGALSQIGALVESPALYEHLSGRANLDVTRRLLGLPAKDVDRVLEIVELERAASKRVRRYSLGMKQRLALARALLGAPKVLMLDEPTNGLDPDGIIAMRDLVRSLPERIGGTVFVSSHMVTEVEQVADHAGIMRDGRLVVQGRLSDILGQQSNFEIEVDDAKAGALLLSANGFDARIVDQGRIEFTCAVVQAKREAARANALLVGAGHSVSSLLARSRTLEGAYRDAVSNMADGVGA